MEPENIELYYSIITTVMDNVEQIACAGCLCLLCRGFFRRKKQIWAIGIIYLALLEIQYCIPVYMGVMIAHMTASGVCLFLMLLEEKRMYGRFCLSTFSVKVYLILVFFSIRDLSCNIAMELYVLCTEKMWRAFSQSVDVANPDAWKLYFGAYVLSTFMMYAVEITLMFLAVRLINRAFYDKSAKYGWKEIILLLIPSGAGFCVHMLRRRYEAVFFQVTTKELINFYAANSSIALLLSLCYLITLAAVIVELYLFQGLRKKQEEEKNQVVLQNQVHDMRSRIAEIERIYAGVRGIRHDLNNHVHVIGQLLEQKQYAQATDYLKTMYQTMEHLAFPIKTGNPVTDVIINEKAREAEAAEITFHSDFSFLSDSPVDVFDISIILKNLLENAFEAVCKTKSQDREIAVHSARKKNAYFITVYNSYDKILSLDENGLPETDKTDGDIHGLGLKNVKMVTEKYFGTLAIEQDEKSVTVTVMLIS
ncbi:MAG: GHKL domain-containing protein [Bacillus sp. (in: Bacteria)]|nr:GHKL domain-containing protein [Bacillus sp. (in: firmicutes)]MCM1426087.1 GHKL domain-containing protein [Eubacterium sp.]